VTAAVRLVIVATVCGLVLVALLTARWIGAEVSLWAVGGWTAISFVAILKNAVLYRMQKPR
jgi:hypothetical protein